MYPPAPLGLNRIVPVGGAIISGHHVPGGVVVGVTPVTAYHSPANFAEASIPERWTESNSPQFKNDKRAVRQPFSAGARNCVGQK
jgi:cytochrome P450